MRRVALFATILITQAGCRHRPETSPATQAATSTVVGTVTNLGSDPLSQVVVRPDSGVPVAIVGRLREEIRQLVGLTVRVTGAHVRGQPPVASAVDVRDYTILSLNGTPVHVGTLQSRSGKLYLDGTESLVLVAPSEELTQVVGSIVWIAGQVDGRSLRVEAYGVIRRR